MKQGLGICKAGRPETKVNLEEHAVNSRDALSIVVDIVGSTVPVLLNQTHAQGKPHDRPVGIVATN